MAANPPWLQEQPAVSGPAEQLPVEQAPVEQAPVEQAPMGQAPAAPAPVEPQSVEPQQVTPQPPVPQWSAPMPPQGAPHQQTFAPMPAQQQYPYPQQAAPPQMPAPHQMPAPQPTPPQYAGPEQPVGTWGPPPAQPPAPAPDLNLLRRAKRPPRSGWRKLVHRASGRRINPGESPADIEYRELVDRVNQPIRGDYRIAFLSLKGGVGKTTTTVGLGSTFASLRGDRVIAVDANPDLGTLAQRVPSQTTSTVRDLLEDGDIHRYSDVRAHTSQAPSRLEVLASEKDPAVSEAFSENDYREVVTILQAYYNIILTDCGTGLMHSAMNGALEMADALVLVSSPAIDGARSASATLDWLDHHGYSDLVKRSIVVVNSARRGASSIDLDQLTNLFLGRCRAVHVVPYDEHLAEGAEIDLDLVGKVARRSFLELAAIVADGFTVAPPRTDPDHVAYPAG